MTDKFKEIVKTNKFSVIVLLCIVGIVGGYNIYFYSTPPADFIQEYYNEEAEKYLEEQLDYNVKVSDINKYDFKVLAKEYRRLINKRNIFELQLEYYNEQNYFVYQCYKINEDTSVKGHLPSYSSNGSDVEVVWETINLNGLELYYFDKKDYGELSQFVNPNRPTKVYVWMIEDVLYKIEDYYNISHEEVLEIVENLNY